MFCVAWFCSHNVLCHDGFTQATGLIMYVVAARKRVRVGVRHKPAVDVVLASDAPYTGGNIDPMSS